MKNSSANDGAGERHAQAQTLPWFYGQTKVSHEILRVEFPSGTLAGIGGSPIPQGDSSVRYLLGAESAPVDVTYCLPRGLGCSRVGVWHSSVVGYSHRYIQADGTSPGMLPPEIGGPGDSGGGVFYHGALVAVRKNWWVKLVYPPEPPIPPAYNRCRVEKAYWKSYFIPEI